MIQTSTIKYAFGLAREIGCGMKQFGLQKEMILADPNLVNHDSVWITIDASYAVGIEIVLCLKVHIEPRDNSFQKAIQFAKEKNFDVYVAIGGETMVDTAKMENLYVPYPASVWIVGDMIRSEPAVERHLVN